MSVDLPWHPASHREGTARPGGRGDVPVRRQHRSAGTDGLVRRTPGREPDRGGGVVLRRSHGLPRGQNLPGVDLLFADTGYHFAETLGLREAVDAVYPVNVRSLRPELTVAEQDHRYGENPRERDPDLCCALRKTALMDNALRGYDAWATGLRRADHAGRAETPIVAWDDKHQMIKINPIAAFTDEMIDACIDKYQIMHNPLRGTSATARSVAHRAPGRWLTVRTNAPAVGRAHKGRVRAASMSADYPCSSI